MDQYFEDLALTVRARNLDVPYNLKDETLYLTIRSDLTELLSDSKTEIFYFGAAPDNTADGQEELFENGVFYRIIGYEKNLVIGLESSPEEVLKAFHYLVGHYEPKWATIFVEQGVVKKEVTIELLYLDVFQ